MINFTSTTCFSHPTGTVGQQLSVKASSIRIVMRIKVCAFHSDAHTSAASYIGLTDRKIGSPRAWS